MKAKATFEYDSSGLVARIRSVATNNAVGIAGATSLAKRAEPFVPKYTGALRLSAVVSPWTVHYMAPYAIYPWTGRNVQHWTTPNTTSHWEQYVNKPDIANDLTIAIRRII